VQWARHQQSALVVDEEGPAVEGDGHLGLSGGGYEWVSEWVSES
jgi:hypothetical protein